MLRFLKTIVIETANMYQRSARILDRKLFTLSTGIFLERKEKKLLLLFPSLYTCPPLNNSVPESIQIYLALQ
jgi:hypothetical protein